MQHFCVRNKISLLFLPPLHLVAIITIALLDLWTLFCTISNEHPIWLRWGLIEGIMSKYNMVLCVSIYKICWFKHWIQNFMISKKTLFDIANKLRPLIVKKNIGYHFAIHVKVQVIYVIYKLSCGSNLLAYNELFTISKSTTVLVTCEITKVINIEFQIDGGCNVKFYKLLCYT
jgi:hypothetical protein